MWLMCNSYKARDLSSLFLSLWILCCHRVSILSSPLSLSLSYLSQRRVKQMQEGVTERGKVRVRQTDRDQSRSCQRVNQQTAESGRLGQREQCCAV